MARTITARYDGECRDCGGRIYAGDRVRWYGRGEGVGHTDSETCDSYREQAAEMAMESFAEARLMGCGSTWHENYYG